MTPAEPGRHDGDGLALQRPPAPVATAYGVLRIGTMHVGLPLEALREVVPCPAHFESLPAAVPGLLGACKLRGRAVPVLDLRGALGLAATPREGCMVAVIRHAGRMLGLLADSVRGIACPSPAEVHRVDTAQGAALLFCCSFERAEDGSVVSVLDPAAVLGLPGLPTLRDDQAGACVAPGSDLASHRRRSMMLVRCAAINLALDVTEVHTTLPYVTLKPSCIGGPLSRGLIEYGDTDVPAIDPLALFGIGKLPPGERCQALLLRLEAGFVALLVSQVIDIVPVADDQLLALPRAALRRPEFFRGLVRPQGLGDHLALQQHALVADADIQALSTLNLRRGKQAEPGPGQTQTQTPTVAHGRSVISFDIGTLAAAPLLQVKEIIELPADRIATCGSQAAVLGLVTHRLRSVTLVCLATLMGRVANFDPATARVLLVDAAPAAHAAGELVGFVVERIFNVEPVLWEQPTPAVQQGAAGRPFAGCPLIELGSTGGRQTLPLLDLRALALAMSHSPGDGQPWAAEIAAGTGASMAAAGAASDAVEGAAAGAVDTAGRTTMPTTADAGPPARVRPPSAEPVAA